MIRYLPDSFSLHDLFFSMVIAAAAIAMIAEYFMGGK